MALWKRYKWTKKRGMGYKGEVAMIPEVLQQCRFFSGGADILCIATSASGFKTENFT